MSISTGNWDYTYNLKLGTREGTNAPYTYTSANKILQEKLAKDKTSITTLDGLTFDNFDGSLSTQKDKVKSFFVKNMQKINVDVFAVNNTSTVLDFSGFNKNLSDIEITDTVLLYVNKLIDKLVDFLIEKKAFGNPFFTYSKHSDITIQKFDKTAESDLIKIRVKNRLECNHDVKIYDLSSTVMVNSTTAPKGRLFSALSDVDLEAILKDVIIGLYPVVAMDSARVFYNYKNAVNNSLQIEGLSDWWIEYTDDPTKIKVNYNKLKFSRIGYKADGSVNTGTLNGVSGTHEDENLQIIVDLDWVRNAGRVVKGVSKELKTITFPYGIIKSNKLNNFNIEEEANNYGESAMVNAIAFYFNEVLLKDFLETKENNTTAFDNFYPVKRNYDFYYPLLHLLKPMELAMLKKSKFPWLMPTDIAFSCGGLYNSEGSKEGIISFSCMIRKDNKDITNNNSAFIDLNAIPDGSSSLIIDRSLFGEKMVVPVLQIGFEESTDYVNNFKSALGAFENYRFKGYKKDDKVIIKSGVPVSYFKDNPTIFINKKIFELSSEDYKDSEKKSVSGIVQPKALSVTINETAINVEFNDVKYEYDSKNKNVLVNQSYRCSLYYGKNRNIKDEDQKPDDKLIHTRVDVEERQFIIENEFSAGWSTGWFWNTCSYLTGFAAMFATYKKDQWGRRDLKVYNISPPLNNEEPNAIPLQLLRNVRNNQVQPDPQGAIVDNEDFRDRDESMITILDGNEPYGNPLDIDNEDNGDFLEQIPDNRLRNNNDDENLPNQKSPRYENKGVTGKVRIYKKTR